MSLTKQLDAFVQHQVESGRYNNASEVVRDALRLLQDREQLRKARLEAVRAQVQEGLADVEAGRVEDADAVFAAAHTLIDKIEQET